MTDWPAVHRDDLGRIAALERRNAQLEATVCRLLDELDRRGAPVVVEVVEPLVPDMGSGTGWPS